jgi:aspartate/methionine/tyrosine aminotransferase
MEALTGPQTTVEQMVAEFARRRDAFCSALNKIAGFSCRPPAGAFYAFANVKGTGMASNDLADLLLAEAGVACLNGASFGANGEGYLRFSFANSIENLLEAARRIGGLSAKWGGIA